MAEVGTTSVVVCGVMPVALIVPALFGRRIPYRHYGGTASCRGRSCVGFGLISLPGFRVLNSYAGRVKIGRVRLLVVSITGDHSK